RAHYIGVALSLIIHVLDLLSSLVQSPVRSVQGLGVAVLGGHEDVANARITFANGCVATVAACRVSRTPKRQTHVWGADGYASLDFARRHLTLIQPTEQFRQRRLNLRQLSPAQSAALQAELFSRHPQVLQVARSARAQ